jgi:hypothetical protein
MIVTPAPIVEERRVLLANRELVTKRGDLRLEGSTGSKSGGYQSEKGDEKRAHRGRHHDLTNDQTSVFSDLIGFSVATGGDSYGIPPRKRCRFEIGTHLCPARLA